MMLLVHFGYQMANIMMLKVLQNGGKRRFSLFLITEIFPDKFIKPLIKRRFPPTVLIKH